MSQRTLVLELLNAVLLLTLVVRMGWAFHIHYEIYLDIVQLLLVHRQYHIIFLEYDLILVALLATPVHVVEDFVLLSDQKGPLDF